MPRGRKAKVKRKKTPNNLPKLRKLLTSPSVEIIIGIVGIVLALVTWKQTGPVSWERFWSHLTGVDLYVDEEIRFCFRNYDDWWSKGRISPPNYLFQNTDTGAEDVDMQFVILNEIHEYVVDRNSDERYVPDADLEYFFLQLPDSRTRAWWTPGASVYLVLQVAPGMVVNQHGMNLALTNFFREAGKYELLNEGYTSSPPVEMKNPSLQYVSFYEIRRIRHEDDILVRIPRFRMAFQDSSRPRKIPEALTPNNPIPMVSDGNNREGSELRACMIVFYRDRTYFNVAMYADPSIYDKALVEVLEPIFESWTFY